MQLLVLSSARSAPDVLPALELLTHHMRVIPPKVADYLAQPKCDAVLVDGRVQPFFACELSAQLLATGRAEPIIGVISTEVAGDLSPHCAVAQLVLCDAGPAEVEARLRLAHPDRCAVSDSTGAPSRLAVGPLVIDTDAYEVRIEDRPLALTSREFDLLVVLAVHAGRALTRGQLLDMVWGYEKETSPRTVDGHIRELRAKLGEDHRDLIRTARGTGYVMARVPPSQVGKKGATSITGCLTRLSH
jgi:DNA-binding winged helix-turn-helix (wHTH) protein